MGANMEVDQQGNLLIYGGQGLIDDPRFGQRFTVLNQLWQWDGTSWTVLYGDSTFFTPKNYGVQGLASPLNKIPARRYCASWIDSLDNFWVLGGVSGNGEKNDLWRWDGTNWTWMGGSQGFRDAGMYGYKGQASATNWPGARSGAQGWLDDQGNYWMFGGRGFDKNGAVKGSLNDLWKWDGSMWTWVSGADTINALGDYGTLGQAAASNQPGARASFAMQKTANGNVIMIGGFGMNDVGASPYLADISLWDGTAWTWIDGSKGRVFTKHGTKGIANPSNTPGGRYGAVLSVNGTGSLVYFGGGTSNGRMYADIWSYSPPYTGPVPTALGPSASSCPGQQVNLAALVRDYTGQVLSWDFYDAPPSIGGRIMAQVPAFRGQARPGIPVMVSPTANAWYWVVVHFRNGSTQNGSVTVTMSPSCGGLVQSVIALQGGWDQNAGQHRNDLNQQNLIPATEPYTALGYQFVGGGGEIMDLSALQQNTVVDWVVVELRDSANPSHVTESRAGLLLQNGSIVAMDGNSAVHFQADNQKSYYFAVLHRNHLGVMTAQPIQLGTAVDFSNPETATYGGAASRHSTGGKALMYAGDADGNGQIQNSDNIFQWMPQVGTSGYQQSDYNLDGQVQNSDLLQLWQPNTGRGSAVPR
jgi:hypothetical protein